MESYFIAIAVTISVIIVVALWKRSNTDVKSSASVLSLYSRDLTALARQHVLDPVIGREHELNRLIQILSRRTKNNPVLIGKSGVGKTAIVEQLANMIAAGEVPEGLRHKRVLQLDLSGLVAGTKYRGEFEKRLKGVVNEIIAAEREIILFIDELHSLAEAGEATGAIDAADILKPALARGELQAIGATTLEEFQRTIAQDETLHRRFQPITVDEPTAEETVKILEGLRPRYEDYHQVKITDEALRAAVELSDKCLLDRHFPDKAIDVLDEAGAKVRLEANAAGKEKVEVPKVAEKDIAEVISEWNADKLCFNKIMEKENEKGD